MKRVILAAAIVTVAAVCGRTLSAQQALPGSGRNPIDPVVLEWDSGPDKIDVSKYPPEIKKNYKVFSDLCARCHPLARAINCDFVTEDDWERYIKRMMRRGRSLITPEQALQAFDFAVYDSKVRKHDEYERRKKQAERQ
jgi:hypothetical protein